MDDIVLFINISRNYMPIIQVQCSHTMCWLATCVTGILEIPGFQAYLSNLIIMIMKITKESSQLAYSYIE